MFTNAKRAEFQIFADLGDRVLVICDLIRKIRVLTGMFLDEIDDGLGPAALGIEAIEAAGGKQDRVRDAQRFLMRNQLGVGAAAVVRVLVNVDDGFGSFLLGGKGDCRKRAGGRQQKFAPGLHHARRGFTTLPCTSVKRKRRPWNLYVSFSWSTPS